MEILHVRTGPFKIEEVISNNPNWLIVKFSDIDPKTGKNSQRKMKKGGQWPQHLAEILEEKAQNLLGEEVIVVTSQTTKDWPTTEYFCDVETISDHVIKTGIGNKIVGADGKSNLRNNLAICADLNLVDCTLANEYFSDEDEYNTFYQTLQKRFTSSVANDKLRHVDEDIIRIRLPDKKRDAGSQGGFRVTVWKALNINNENFNYYIVLKTDRKTLEKKFPDKSEMKNKIEKIREVYKDLNLVELVKGAIEDGKDKPIQPLEPPKNTYLNCPYSDKDECKSYGGRWDKDNKQWFVPAGLPLDKFKKWLP